MSDETPAPDSDPTDLLKQLRRSHAHPDKEVLVLADRPSYLYQDRRCDSKEYCVLETNRRGTWNPAARVLGHMDSKALLNEYEGSLAWVTTDQLTTRVGTLWPAPTTDP